jgi:tRNA-splicing ligase RtcB (3'-phosphate/5'-hydroxy nucleic acid ligase)
MIPADKLVQIAPHQWELPISYRSDMRVPVRLLANEALLQAALRDQSLVQAVNASTLPGLISHVAVMPDVHQGYGFPIGGVAASRVKDGIISPGGIGYDINCGVRLLSSQIYLEEVNQLKGELAEALFAHCPSGVGTRGSIKLTARDLDGVCRQGSKWALEHGYATADDLEKTEDFGRIQGAQVVSVSARAKERGRPQLGTLGAGNHFIEVDVVDEVFDSAAAEAMGLSKGKLAVQIHSGSRGFGHQICSDYVRELQSAVHRYGISLPDRELVCAPLESQEGQSYLSAMACAANYAFANRQVLAHHARNAFEEVLRGRVHNWDLIPVYDLAHNIGKIETHQVDGRDEQVCVHRKGATRAFGPSYPDLPEVYRPFGQPVLVPGSMGTASWILVGTDAGMEISFGSSCHGAGRLMSRKKAKKSFQGRQLLDQLERDGIYVRSGSMRGLAEESPRAYKDVDAVVDVVTSIGIARKVARLRPVVVVKG